MSGSLILSIVTFVYGLAGFLYICAWIFRKQIFGEIATWVALVLVTGGLLIKSALFPLHFWLPSAHANAPAPVSATTSRTTSRTGVSISSGARFFRGFWSSKIA